MAQKRVFDEINTYVKVDLGEVKSRHNQYGVVDDNQTVYSRDQYWLLYQDPPGSGIYKKVAITYTLFTTGILTVDEISTATTVNANNITYTGTLSGPTTTTLAANFAALDVRITATEAAILAYSSGAGAALEYTNLTPVTRAASGPYANLWDTPVTTNPSILTLNAGTGEFTAQVTGTFLIQYTASKSVVAGQFYLSCVKGAALPDNASSAVYGRSERSNATAITTSFILPVTASDVFTLYYSNSSVPYDTPNAGSTTLNYNRAFFIFFEA